MILMMMMMNRNSKKKNCLLRVNLCKFTTQHESKCLRRILIIHLTYLSIRPLPLILNDLNDYTSENKKKNMAKQQKRAGGAEEKEEKINK